MLSDRSRSIILISLGLIGLLMLCVPISRAYGDDTDLPVLSVYMTNAGARLTFGTSLSPLPLYELTINTWDRTDLYGDPPNLVLNNSPLKYFRYLLTEAKPFILKQLLAHKEWMDAPLQVYIGAAGADKAETMSIPDRSVLSYLNPRQLKQCYNPELSRKDFYQCAFTHEVNEILHRPPLSPKIDMIVEQDTHLINSMAWFHAQRLHKAKPGQPAIVIHSTSISQPYLMKDGQVIPLEGWMPPALQKKGGTYQIGEEFQNYLNSTDSSDLIDAIEHDQRSYNHPLGQKENFKRLKRGKGYNNYGRIVGETGVEINKQHLKQNGLNTNSLAYSKAVQIAMPMIEKARKAFVQLTLALYARNQNLFDGHYPHIIIVGEESDILFPNLSTFHSTVWNVISEARPSVGDWQRTVTLKRKELADSDKMKAWLENDAGHIVQNVSILPVTKFARYQHRASVKRLNPGLYSNP
ncbi:hypothetical protein M3P05_18780 [Sansalvadorimonas sp. 2012CJ34-2]|uniref:Uncharacterized protein n=1 Tax=Parendozoicomonas callyspongiae TaxID=2942213 RepID=A0ABT0PKR4_9GAMM|nr:hypothetical protein [Sansalvadorimonas sp. 2012CJ34-2]MCL6271969.1 hypothetical protein [Sansalvadorimonas sp. 2012CJ34-2]